MWIEVKPRNAPRETLLFGPGCIMALSPGATGSVLVFASGNEMEVEDKYSTLRDQLTNQGDQPFYSLYQARQMAEALRLITTWTTPGLATPETVAYAHEKARDVLGLPD